MRHAEEEEIINKLSSDTPPHDAASDLRNQIRMIVLTPHNELSSFDKLREVAKVIRDQLDRHGEFFRTSDDRCFYFFRTERKVFDLGQTPFENILKHLSGLSAAEKYYNFAIDMLRATVARTAPSAQVHAIAHFDPDSRRLVISDGQGGMWSREPGGNWEFGHNGQGKVYFATEPEAESFYPDLASDDNSLGWFLNQFLFTDQAGGLTSDDARLLMKIWLLQQLFPVLRQTRIIPSFLGPQGSGKTTGAKLVGRLFVGPRFDVTGIHQNKEADWIAAVSNRTFVGFDNADTRVDWMSDQLARYATGQRFQIRKLYSNNEEITFATRASILVTSRDPHFNRADVAERLLPLWFKRPKEYSDELEIFEQLARRRNCIWGELLVCAARVVDTLDLSIPIRLKFRMADFANFGLRALGTERKESWVNLLTKLSRAQSEFATEGDSLTETLRLLLEKEDQVRMTTGELFKKLQRLASENNLWFPDSAAGFGKMLQRIQTMVETELGVDITITERGSAGKRLAIISRKNDSSNLF